RRIVLGIAKPLPQLLGELRRRPPRKTPPNHHKTLVQKLLHLPRSQHPKSGHDTSHTRSPDTDNNHTAPPHRRAKQAGQANPPPSRRCVFPGAEWSASGAERRGRHNVGAARPRERSEPVSQQAPHAGIWWFWGSATARCGRAAG